jgi:hypothetical protein
MKSKIYPFRLREGRDDDLIQWLDGLPEGERSFYLRQALRKGLGPVDLEIPSAVTAKGLNLEPPESTKKPGISKQQPEPVLEPCLQSETSCQNNPDNTKLDKLLSQF